MGTILVSILFCFAIAEIAIRVVIPEEPEPEDLPSSIRLFDYGTHDPYLGWALKPGAVGSRVTSEYQTHISINSRGVRGPEIPYAKAGDERRVLILGDSFAEGYTVDIEKRFSNLLEEQLGSRVQGRASVVNLGVGGYSNDQELILFRREGMKYNADVVVLLVHDNDIFYNIRDRYWSFSKPVFSLTRGALVLTNTPIPPPQPVSKSQSRQLQLTGVEFVQEWLNSRSHLIPRVAPGSEK